MKGISLPIFLWLNVYKLIVLCFHFTAGRHNPILHTWKIPEFAFFPKTSPSSTFSFPIITLAPQFSPHLGTKWPMWGVSVCSQCSDFAEMCPWQDQPWLGGEDTFTGLSCWQQEFGLGMLSPLPWHLWSVHILDPGALLRPCDPLFRPGYFLFRPRGVLSDLKFSF